MELDAKSQRFVALCILGALLFNFPLLAVFNVQASFLGVPVLYLYLFGAWAGLIGLLALVAEARR